jgi:hypothetical protein
MPPPPPHHTHLPHRCFDHQTHYILVKGGNLSIGTRDTPFAGTAAITLHGPADARELPLYGAKVLGVRDGHVVMHGKPKTPTWTRLAATADIGDTQVVVTGTVNWVPGGLGGWVGGVAAEKHAIHRLLVGFRCCNTC